jgi:hypothetical protein
MVVMIMISGWMCAQSFGAILINGGKGHDGCIDA